MTQQQKRAEQFPMPTDRVALMDIDGTLIDTKYEVTDTSILCSYPRCQGMPAGL